MITVSTHQLVTTIDEDVRNSVDPSNDGDGTTDKDRTNCSNDADGDNGVDSPNDGDGTIDEDRTNGSNDADEIDTTDNCSIGRGMLSGLELDTWTVVVVVPFKAAKLFNGMDATSCGEPTTIRWIGCCN